MIDIPKRIKEEWTKATILIDSASNLEEAVIVEMAEQLFIGGGHSYPQWLKLMIDWKQRSIYLTSEEYFHKNRSPLTDPEMSILVKEIDNLHTVIGEGPFKQALYVIAYQVLKGDNSFDDGLSFEWHCLTAGEPLLEDHVRNLFVQILKREIAFWQLGLKPSLRLTQAALLDKFKTPSIDISKAMRIEESERIWEIIKHNTVEWRKGNLHNIKKITPEMLNYGEFKL